VAICAGIGAGYLIKNIANFLTRRRSESKAVLPLKAALSIIFIIICLLTVPLAYNGETFYGIQDSTYRNEFRAMSWLSDNAPEYQVSSSERLSDIMGPYFDISSDQTLPWQLRHNRAIPGGKILFMEAKWTSIGAQMTPMEPFIINQSTYDSTINTNDLIYSSSGGHTDIFILRVD
jgi:hypothetical protein